MLCYVIQMANCIKCKLLLFSFNILIACSLIIVSLMYFVYGSSSRCRVLSAACDCGISWPYLPDFHIRHACQTIVYRPLAGYGLPPPRGNFVDHIFHEAQCLARILQHVSPLTMAALSCNSVLHTLPYKIFDN